jgi:hypothetical protein
MLGQGNSEDAASAFLAGDAQVTAEEMSQLTSY